MANPHIHVAPQVDTRKPSSECLVGYAFLSHRELSLFRQLTDNRRSLPVYRSGYWVCCECPFESMDLPATARHIMRTHAASPTNKEDLDEDDSDLGH